jgi:hypothetical protein
MLTLEDSVNINASPEDIFNWFDNIVKNYKSWHKDHTAAEWGRGESFQEGSILYIEEKIGGKLEKLTFEVTKYVPNRLIEYKLLSSESVICSGGSFKVKPYSTGSCFTATLSFRFGYLLSKLMPAKLDAIKTHMKEEGENLKKILEKKR